MTTGDQYQPERVLDAAIQVLGVKNDAGLARALVVAPPVISKIRRHRALLSDALLIRIHEETGLHIKELKALMGPRPRV
jgi:antitoxin HigA-1